MQTFCNDHIIRGEKDYKQIWEHIDTNVLRWKKDCFYTDEKEQFLKETAPFDILKNTQFKYDLFV